MPQDSRSKTQAHTFRSSTMPSFCRRTAVGFLLRAMLLLTAGPLAAIPAQILPRDIPATFVPRVESFDYTKREEMIPMRDGGKLQTITLIPNGPRPPPPLFTRPPYRPTS